MRDACKCYEARSSKETTIQAELHQPTAVRMGQQDRHPAVVTLLHLLHSSHQIIRQSLNGHPVGHAPPARPKGAAMAPDRDGIAVEAPRREESQEV